MTVGLIEGVTQAIGAELTALGGFRLTRLTAPFLADVRVAQGVGSASSVDAGVTITLAGGDEFDDVTTGMIFRVTSGALAGTEAEIASIAPTTAGLDGAGVGDDLTDESWEVISRQTTASVETTLGWDSTGVVFIDGQQYAYSGTTISSLTGMEHHDGVSYVPGAGRDHAPLAEVLDFTRTYSAIDKLRRSLFTRTATDAELNVVGSNLAIGRPPLLTDTEVYRRLVEALAYAPRGTVYAIELALNAILGAGNWEMFEELTIGSLRHACTVFLRRLGVEDSSDGKAYLDGFENRLMSSTTEVSVGQTPLRVYSVRYADEPAELVAQGTGSATSGDGGVTITGPASTFPAIIKQGDRFTLLTSGAAGQTATVFARLSDTELTLDGDGLGRDFNGFSWRVTRDHTDTRYYRPSSDSRLEHATDTGSVMWTYTGAAAETAHVTLENDTAAGGVGRYLKLVDPGNAEVVTYRRRARILPESDATFDFTISAGGTLSDVDGDELQIAFHMRDGERDIAVGALASGIDLLVGFVTTDPGTVGTRFIGETTTIELPDQREFTGFQIVKRGREEVRLYRNGVLIDSIAHGSFYTSALYELSWGLESGTAAGAELYVKGLGWSVRTPVELWNVSASGDTVNPNEIDNGSGFDAGDVTDSRRVRITAKGDCAGTTGNPRGEWIVIGSTGSDEATLKGAPRTRARVKRGLLNRITVEGDPHAFTFPDVLGHQIKLTSGVNNTQVRTIVRVLDPVSFRNYARLYDGTGADVGALLSFGTDAGGNEMTPTFTSSVIEVSGAALAEDSEITWELVPQFAASTGIEYTIVDKGTVTGADLTLPSAHPFAADPVVSVHYTTVASAQARDEKDSNTETANVFLYRPLYLSDSFSWIRKLIDSITAGGVLADYDSLIRDASGPHLMRD